MFGIPYNSMAWLIGAVSVFLFSWKSFLAYKESGNQIARIYFWLSMAFGIGFLAYALPPIFVRDENIIKITYILSEAGVQIGLLIQIWLLWFIGLRNKVRLRYLYAVGVPYSAAIILIEALTSTVTINPAPLLIAQSDITIALIMKYINFFVICWPLGYFFIVQAKLQPTTKARITSITTGLIFIIVSAGAITAGGGDTVTSSLIDGIIFFFFIIINLIPKRIISFEHQTPSK